MRRTAPASRIRFAISSDLSAKRPTFTGPCGERASRPSNANSASLPFSSLPSRDRGQPERPLRGVDRQAAHLGAADIDALIEAGDLLEQVAHLRRRRRRCRAAARRRRSAIRLRELQLCEGLHADARRHSLPSMRIRKPFPNADRVGCRTSSAGRRGQYLSSFARAGSNIASVAAGVEVVRGELGDLAGHRLRSCRRVCSVEAEGHAVDRSSWRSCRRGCRAARGPYRCSRRCPACRGARAFRRPVTLGRSHRGRRVTGGEMFEREAVDVRRARPASSRRSGPAGPA